MALFSEVDLAQFSPFIPLSRQEWTARMQAARIAAPIAKSPMGALIIRHDKVTELLHDDRLRGPGMDLSRMAGIPENSLTWKRRQSILLFMEGEDHHRLRRLVSKAFTPRAVENLRPYTRSVIRGLLDRVFATGHCDAVASLCNPFPIPVICALVGVEADRIDDMSRWATSILLSLRFDAGSHIQEIEAAQGEMDAYVDSLIAARRQSPQDDLLSRLIAAEEAGDKLSRDELQAVVAMMLVAGTDTTRNQLANMIHTFAQFPNEWTKVRANPALVPNAVEEAIRWEPATVAMPRFAVEDIEIEGLTIPKGTFVGLMSKAANHDPAALPDPDRFDVSRASPDGWRLLTFGGGIHYCLGANLARVELTEALAELANRWQTLRLDGEPTPNPLGAIIEGYQALPVAWT